MNPALRSPRSSQLDRKRIRVAKPALFGFLLLSPYVALAQQAPTASAKPGVPDEVVELSPFSVSATAGTGWFAATSMVEARTATSLKNEDETITLSPF